MKTVNVLECPVVTVSCNEYGEVSPEQASVIPNKSFTFSMTADDYYHIGRIALNDSEIASHLYGQQNADYSVSGRTSDSTVSVAFWPNMVGEVVPEWWLVEHSDYCPGDTFEEQAYSDFDNDGLVALLEYEKECDPNDEDTDDDGLLDGDEYHFYKTDPTKQDTDGDGLNDAEEIQWGTDPNDSASKILNLATNAEITVHGTVTSPEYLNDGATGTGVCCIKDSSYVIMHLETVSCVKKVSLVFHSTYGAAYDSRHKLYASAISESGAWTYIGGQGGKPYPVYECDPPMMCQWLKLKANPLCKKTKEWEVWGVTHDPSDTDGDGMPNEWEYRNGLDPFDPADADDDDDSDGFINIVEYEAGSDPQDENSFPHVNEAPVAVISADPISGVAALTVNFDATESTDSDGSIVDYAWDFGDGTMGEGCEVSHVYNEPGIYEAILTVTDNNDAQTSTRIDIVVADPIVNNALVGYWSFDENDGDTVYDSSGNNNHGVMQNGPQWVNGQFGSALQFDSTDDYIQMSDIPVDLEEGAHNTVAFWMCWDGGTSEMPFAWDTYYDLFLINGALGFTTCEGSVLGISSDGLANKWVHVTAVFYNGVPSAETCKLYINGEHQSISDLVGQTTRDRVVSDQITISGCNTYASYKFGGKLDDIRIYSGELGVEEIRLLMNNESPIASFSAIIDESSVNYDASDSTDPDGSIVSCIWDFGDGEAGEGISVSHTYAMFGDYSVTLTVKDNRGVVSKSGMTVCIEDLDKDSDLDGLTDYEEIHLYHTDPDLSDTDNDGLEDGEEVLVIKTDPLNPDSDSDGLSDRVEVETGTNPLAMDTDRDGWADDNDPDPRSRAFFDWGGPDYYEGGQYKDPYWPDWVSHARLSSAGEWDTGQSAYTVSSSQAKYAGSPSIYLNSEYLSSEDLLLWTRVNLDNGNIYFQLRDDDWNNLINSFVGAPYNPQYEKSYFYYDDYPSTFDLELYVPLSEEETGSRVILHRWVGGVTWYDSELFIDGNHDGLDDTQLNAVLSAHDNGLFNDHDDDGLNDYMEYLCGMDFACADEDDNGIIDVYDDFDGDGLSNYEECDLGTNPWDVDSDGDLLDDRYEYLVLGMDPTEADEWADLFDRRHVLSGGASHSVAVDEDGVVWSWGRYTYGELGDGRIGDIDHIGTWPPQDQMYSQGRPVQAVIPGNPRIVEVVAGSAHSLAVDEDGNVYAWGSNQWGDLGVGGYGGSETSDARLPYRVEGIPPMKSLAAGYYHNIGLTENGGIWTWGSGWEGQLGAGWFGAGHLPVEVDLEDVVAVAAGCRHGMALKADGTVWTWGRNDYGQIGNNDTNNVCYPVKVEGLSNIVAISAGNYHSIALMGDGTVWSWGNNQYGQLGIDDEILLKSLVPVQISSALLKDVVQIEGYYHGGMALTGEGDLYVWGAGGNGQLGDNGYSDVISPVLLQGAEDLGLTLDEEINLGGGGYHNLMMTGNGYVYSWGCNHYGQLGYMTLWNTHRQPVTFIGLNLKGEEPDTDGDGVTDIDELEIGTDPKEVEDVYTGPVNGTVDSDGDGYMDDEENEMGSDPKSITSMPVVLTDMECDEEGNIHLSWEAEAKTAYTVYTADEEPLDGFRSLDWTVVETPLIIMSSGLLTWTDMDMGDVNHRYYRVSRIDNLSLERVWSPIAGMIKMPRTEGADKDMIGIPFAEFNDRSGKLDVNVNVNFSSINFKVGDRLTEWSGRQWFDIGIFRDGSEGLGWYTYDPLITFDWHWTEAPLSEMNIGEGFCVRRAMTNEPGSEYVFVGEVPYGDIEMELHPGYNMISLPYPVKLDINDVFPAEAEVGYGPEVLDDGYDLLRYGWEGGCWVGNAYYRDYQEQGEGWYQRVGPLYHPAELMLEPGECCVYQVGESCEGFIWRMSMP